MDLGPATPDLVALAQAGDRDAFAALYDQTSRALFLYVVGIVGRTDDAEDVLHTAYLAAWERLPTLRQPALFSAWLFRIGRNAARDVLRSARRRSSAGDDKPAASSGPSAHGPRWSPSDRSGDGHRVPVLDALLDG